MATDPRLLRDARSSEDLGSTHQGGGNWFFELERGALRLVS
jgi:hypothetical protein